MSMTQAAGPSRCAKADSQYLLLCLTIWRVQHDPEAGWTLIEAARDSDGENKKVALTLLRSMVNDESHENTELNLGLPDASRIYGNRAETMCGEEVSLAPGERG